MLWLQGDAIIAAFEVEHTTAIYSGLLRMSDLVSMQPNLKIDLFMVAPDERREKVAYEINRPTFARREASPAKGMPVHPLLGAEKRDRADRGDNQVHEAGVHSGDRGQL